MISFRLSQEEYQRFRALCAENGVRSISDLARTALQGLVAARHHSDPLALELCDLRSQVQTLSGEIDRLSQRLSAREAVSGM